MSDEELKEIQSIIRKYDTAMQQYCEEILPRFGKYLETNRKPYDNFLKRLFEFYAFSNYLIDTGLFKKSTDNDYPLKIIYTKGAMAYHAIYQCLYSGCVSEASALMRSLFEAMVNLKLILQSDTETRLRLYANYRFASKWLHSISSPDTFTGEERKIIENKYMKIKNDYHPKRPYHWAWKIFCEKNPKQNPSFKHICEHLDLMENYNKIYSTLSISIHTDPHIDNLYTLNGKLIVIPHFSNLVYPVGFLSTHYFTKIINGTAEYFKLANCKEIITYINCFLNDLNENYCKRKQP